MSNLVEELGRGYFNDRFRGSMFFTKDKIPAIVMGTNDDETVLVQGIKGVVGKLSTDTMNIPNDFFKDMSVLAVPNLGWRSAMKGRLLTYLYRNNRSYARGVTTGNIQRADSALTSELLNTDQISHSYVGRESVLAALVLTPEYTSFREGIEQLMKGDILSFAVSANVAVTPVSETEYAIMFNRSRVGTVSENGNITCNIPLVNKLLKE